MSKNKKICYVANLSSTFIKRDYQILKKHFEVDVIQPPKKKSRWLKYAFILTKKVKKSELTFCWFAGWHSAFAVLFSKVFRKKSIVIVGGYDAAYVPEIGYGSFTNLKNRLPAKFVFKNADFTISISQSNQRELLDKVKPKRNILIYNGSPLEKYPMGDYDKEEMAITVGTIKWPNLKRKAIEIFVKTAQFLPDVPFVVIGKFVNESIGYLKSIASPNVKFLGSVSDEELLQWCQQAKVYMQASAHEGFGIALAESMSCGCIPVVTERFALPEVVGNIGFYVPYGDEKATADAIKKALNSPPKFGEKARERIKKKFPLEKREKKWRESLERFLLMKKHKYCNNSRGGEI
jgi:glycosyltransferase involved in cell wall biosynthesis